ncbi:TOM1-like protein 9 [Camellia lanceoleosa]|uniref:TOM1-like protein 9 n=1 Tax=Camellia lanceoleosa TaxID=1840588 RepID=A0ACC0FUT5_9ERIC|nr:TOM1-like protein 9 [Camellia lanceoleosa]
MDLLSGDDFNSPSSANTLAIVPAEPQSNSPVANQQNALALVDMFSQNNNNQPVYPVGQAYRPSTPQLQQQQNFQPPQTSVYSNRIGPNMMVPQYEQPLYTQGPQSNSSLPPPPWEAQSADNSQLEVSQYPQPMQLVTQVAVTHAQPMPSGMHQGSQPGGMYIQPMTAGHLSSFNNQVIQSNQMAEIHPQQIPGGQMGMYPVPYITTALMDTKLGTEGRKDLFDWLSRQLSGLSNFPDAGFELRSELERRLRDLVVMLNHQHKRSKHKSRLPNLGSTLDCDVKSMASNQIDHT